MPEHEFSLSCIFQFPKSFFQSLYGKIQLREKCPNTEYFLAVFSRIRTEIRSICRISHSVRMRENTDQKILRISTHFTQCTSQRKLLFLAYFKQGTA